MKLVLPDKSLIYFDPTSFRFFTEDNFTPGNKIKLANTEEIAQRLVKPELKFGDMLRRVNDTPKYAPVGSKYEWDLMKITRTYRLPYGGGYGGMFASQLLHYNILDGRISQYLAEGWGGPRSWTAVEGYEAVRLVCLFFGIKQPKTLKGEVKIKSLAEILAAMSEYEVNYSYFRS